MILQPHADVLDFNDTVEYKCKPSHWLASDRSLNSIKLRCNAGNVFEPVTNIGFCLSGDIEMTIMLLCTVNKIMFSLDISCGTPPLKPEGGTISWNGQTGYQTEAMWV